MLEEERTVKVWQTWEARKEKKIRDKRLAFALNKAYKIGRKMAITQ